MAPTTEVKYYSVKNELIENYVFLIFIKLAILCAFKVIKAVYSVHASYKKSIKKRYNAKDLEAQKPQATPRATN